MGDEVGNFDQAAGSIPESAEGVQCLFAKFVQPRIQFFHFNKSLYRLLIDIGTLYGLVVLNLSTT